MNGLIHDLHYALRQLRKSPGFTTVAVLTLALGVGANTAIFTLLDQVLLRSLPVKEPKQLVLLGFSGTDTGSTFSRADNDKIYFSYPMYRDLRDHNSVFNGLIATDWAQVGVQWHNQPELADAELVSGNYFDVLGVQPAMGRLFVPSDDVTPEGSSAAVLSFSYWQRRFGSDPKIVNQSISINGHPFTVIGVSQPGFHSVVGGDNPAVFVPMTMKSEITPARNDLEDRRSRWLNIVGRLKPGLNRLQAQAGIDPLWHSIRAEELKQIGQSPTFRDEFLTNSHLLLSDGSKGVPLNKNVPTALLVITGLAILMALVSCTNVASLLLVKMARRTREISLRYALGARGRQLMRQLFTEGVSLGMAGGILGIFLSPQLAVVLIHTIWGRDAHHLGLAARPDLRILAFNFGLALFVSVLFSLAPVLQLRRPDVAQTLKQQSATVMGGSSHWRRISVAAQIGLSLLLLIGAGLFVRTLHNLKTLDVGFSTDHLVTFRVDPTLAGYKTDQTTLLYQEILDKLSGVPGVRSAATTNDPELANNNWRNNVTIAGYRPADKEDMNVEWARVGAEYFSTLKMPLLTGRAIEEQDQAGTHKVAVVNEAFARRYFGQPQNALGHYFCSGAGDVKPDIEIVGVVQNARHTKVRSEIRGSVFTPYLQEQNSMLFSLGMTFYVRTWQSPEAAESTIRQAMYALDSKLVLDDFRTMQQQVDEDLINERVIAFLATSFGVLAVLLAGIGIYGVLAYSTAQRTREIGVRIAIGASRGGIVQMVLTEVIGLASIGLAIGLPLSLLLARLVRAQLFGVSDYDPLTFCVVCLLMIAAALVSATIPARRAAKVDPMVALRYE